MKRPTPGQILLILVGLGLGIVFVHRLVVAFRSDETRVRMVLDDVVRYARDRDPGAVLEYLDPDFRHPRGHDRREIEAAVRYLLMHARSVEAEIEPLSPVTVEGDVATVRLRARATVSLPGEAITLKQGGYRGEIFDVQLRRHKSYFRAISVREVAEGEERSP